MTEVPKNLLDLDVLPEDQVLQALRSHFSRSEPTKATIIRGNQEWAVRVHVKPAAKTSLVLLNGAVDRSKSNGAIFQRSSWSSEFKGNVINIADSTLMNDPEMSIGWAQGSSGQFVSRQAEIARLISEALGVGSAENRVYFGSSAGGFQALVMSTLDRGSTAVVNNPQVDWTLYYKSVVDRVLDVCHAGRSVAEVVGDQEIVTNAADLMIQEANIPNIHYYVNSASYADVAKHLPRLLSALREYPKLSKDKTILINHYYDEKSGHNPLPKDVTINNLNQIIGKIEKTSEMELM